MAKQCGCIPGVFLCPEAQRLWTEYLLEGDEEVFRSYNYHVGYRKPCGCMIADKIVHCPEGARLYQAMEQAARQMDETQRAGIDGQLQMRTWQRWVSAHEAYASHLRYNADTDTDVTR